ncbi:MAG: BMP family ABC transporter substrate-binding protein [Lachnospiraceae bacterium]|nr:BMP family ABC transporter substrate-binding protein [Lachnospiraceae bacterium]
MAYSDYEKAVKIGKRDYQSRLIHGMSPTLDVLDDILHNKKTLREVPIGLESIPLELIVGTKTSGRSNSFAHNFMPLLDIKTEFASKWISLSIFQEKEGITDAIEVYEYMNKYYVLEGNKRVSVMKYFNAASIPGIVTRILPPKTNDKDSIVYYEYIDFHELTGINYIIFSEPGSYDKLISAVGKNPGEPWSDDDKINFRSLYLAFQTSYRQLKGDKLENITESDAFLSFIQLHGYEELVPMTVTEIKDLLSKGFEEIKLLDNQDVELVMTTPGSKRFTFSKLMPGTVSKLKIAFIYEKTPLSSAWTYSHELGRLHLDEVFDEHVFTMYYDNVDETDIEATIDSAIKEGCNLIFTTSPTFSNASLKAAIDNPKIHILNCALHDPHSLMRTYYSRMYEAKFIMGAVAGAMAENDTIAYIADYPIYGTIANINAFALGVKMTNPRAKIDLLWSCLKNIDIAEKLNELCPDIVSDKDLSVPEEGTRYYGLYKLENNNIWNLAIPIYHWGGFYEQIVRSVLEDTYRADDGKNGKSISYWWGMAENSIDIVASQGLPDGIKRLIDLLKKTICSGDFNPFSGTIYSQDKKIINEENQTLSPNDIINIDWLSDNINGSIPTLDQLSENAKPVTLQQGVLTEKDV